MSLVCGDRQSQVHRVERLSFVTPTAIFQTIKPSAFTRPHSLFVHFALRPQVQVCVPAHPFRLFGKLRNRPALGLPKPSAQADRFGNLPVCGDEELDLIATIPANTTDLRIEDGTTTITAGTLKPIPDTPEVTWCGGDPHPLRHDPHSAWQISA
ncbi:MAG: hypothetical protein V7695_15965 [Sulfitobacter sp.]